MLLRAAYADGTVLFRANRSGPLMKSHVPADSVHSVARAIEESGFFVTELDNVSVIDGRADFIRVRAGGRDRTLVSSCFDVRCAEESTDAYPTRDLLRAFYGALSTIRRVILEIASHNGDAVPGNGGLTSPASW